MSRLLAYLLALVLLGAVAYSAAAQEVLRPAKLQARASRRQPNYLNIKKIGITVMVTVTPYVMSGEVTDYGLSPSMLWKKSTMCFMFLAIFRGGLLLKSE